MQDLPSTKLQIQVFHAFANNRPASAWLMPEEDARVLLEVRPFPMLQGEVLLDDEPVAGAVVSLRFANLMSATQGALGPSGDFYKSQPIDIAPQVAQETRTDAEGRFWFGLDRSAGDACFVTVTSSDGRSQLTRSISTRTESLTIDFALTGG